MTTLSNLLKVATLSFAIVFSSCTDKLDTLPQPAPNTTTEIETEIETPRPDIAGGATPTQADIGQLGNLLSNRLMNTVGYAAIISYKGTFKTSRNAGSARLAQDAPTRTMSIFDRYSIASVSKTISAVALMKVISTKPQGNALLDTPIWTYLPKHWSYTISSKKITFIQLLNHTSGIRAGSQVNTTSDYSLLKKIMADGVVSTNVGVPMYENANYSFLRLLIPALANYPINQISAPTASKEESQAKQYADAYKDYCRQVIFSKLGSCSGQVIDCKNDHDDYLGLFYSFPSAGVKGLSFGDLTMAGAYQGWVLNTFQMDEFFRKLVYTDLFTTSVQRQIMFANLAGYDVTGKTTDGINYYCKNGAYTMSNGRGYRSLIIGFSDDIQITIMANSPINLQDAAIAAHQDWVTSSAPPSNWPY